MKQRKKLFSHLLITILTLGILCSFTQSSFANYHQFHSEYEKLNDEQKQQVDDILSSLKTDLEKWGLTIPDDHKGKHDFLKDLDKDTKTKVKEIIIALEDGKLTKEEADRQLTDLGVTLPEKECKVLENLDEDTKKEAKEILKQMKEGSITEQQGKEKLDELGVEMPKHPMREHFDKLDEATKEKVIERVNKAKSEFEELGISFPHKYDQLTK